MITREQIVRWLEGSAAAIEANAMYLTDLDAAIGDADHGANMARGFRKVQAGLPAVRDGDLSTILKAAGMALISSVGGAAGPLYGSFFLAAASAAGPRQTLSDPELGDVLRAALDGVARRGKAAPGDKTMVDALRPAVDAFYAALADGQDTAGALAACAAAAEVGMQATIPMVAHKGRASYLGERSAGHQDPGATSSYLLLRALAEAVAPGA